MIFVDSNIPMYLIGAPHRHKTDAQRLLEKLLSERIRLVTDAEVLQEILHRYAAIDRLDAIQPAFEALLGVIDEVLQVDLATVEPSTFMTKASGGKFESLEPASHPRTKFPCGPNAEPAGMQLSTGIIFVTTAWRGSTTAMAP